MARASETSAGTPRTPPTLPRVRHYIDGQWRDAINGGEYPDHDPWTGDVIATVAAGDIQDTRRAVVAAGAAQASWADISPTERQQIFLRAAEALNSRRDEIAGLLTTETGCGRHVADLQVTFCASLLRQAAGLAYAPSGHMLPSDQAGTRAFALRRPVGVVGAISTWNASLTLAGRAIIGPMAVGNTVVLKPSEESPLTGGSLWADLFDNAGLPPGVLNVVTHAPGDAGATAEEMIANPLVRRLNFTGSTVVGRRLAESAGRHLKRVVLQLSGQNPLLVLADADLAHAVDAAIYGAFVHQGQICMCARRILIEQPIAEEFTTRFVAKAAELRMGDPSDPATAIGPLINKWALSLVARRVNEAVELGARLLTGGTPQPPCYPVTVLADVPVNAEIAFEETFGPVVVLEPVNDADDAIRRANSSRFGLTAGVLTSDPHRGLEIARRLDSGIVHVNDQPVNDEPQMPFGGTKDSGYGRFGVGFAMEEFTDLQWVTTRDNPRAFPF